MTRALLLVYALVWIALPLRAEEPACDPAWIEQQQRVDQLLTERKLTEAGEGLEVLGGQLASAGCDWAKDELALLRGRLFLDQGQLTEADGVVRRLRPPEGAPEKLRADALYIQGSIAYELGQTRRARNLYEQLLELDRQAGDPRLVASDLYMIAGTFVDQAVGVRDRLSVIERYREALAEAEAIGGAEQVPGLYILLGKLLGDAEGQALLERGLGLATLADDRVAALGALAVLALDSDRRLAAERLNAAIQEANEALEEQGNPWPMLNLWGDRSTVRWNLLPPEEALADTEEVLGLIERVREEQDDPVFRAGLLAVWTEVYQWLAGKLFEELSEPATSADLARVFEVAERYRARVLIDSLTAAGATVDEPGETEGAFASLTEVRGALADNEAMLAFQIAPLVDVFGRFAGGSWLMVLTRESAQAYRLPDRGSLEHRVRAYLGLLAHRGAEAGAAVRLYQDLLQPALTELPKQVDTLILVPDGDLHLLPFAALRAVAGGPHLAARFQLSRVPSATLWMRWRGQTVEPSQAASLVLADPLPGGVRRSAHRDILGPLPYAAEEGRRVASLLGPDSVLRLGAEASEAFFKSQPFEGYDLVHFAAHGVVDDVHPQLSAVLLAPGEGEDGELQAHEIAELDLAQRIVVLSACHSASGGVLRGEGVLSLARAFFEAGASTVIGSLWPLDDREAQLLFEVFYRYLAQGRSVRESLQRAQHELRVAGAPVAAWSGVVVLGAGDRMLRPARSWLASVGRVLPWLILVLVAGFVLARWRAAR